jgi:DNA-binding CsgD family transcriptional regulator
MPDKRPFPQPAAQYVPAKPAHPLNSTATTGGLTGMAGGTLIVIGWLLGGGIPILSLVFAGGLLTGSLAGDGIGALFTLLALILAGIVVYVPITGLLCVRTGVNLFELRAYTGSHEISLAKGELQLLRSRATTILIMMLLMAAFISIIPFIGQALLGQGYWLMVGGAVITFLGALFARSQIDPEIVTKAPKPKKRELNEEERQMLWLLAEGLSLTEIAERLNISQASSQSLKLTLLHYFSAEDTALLIKRARAQGILPPI